MTSLLCCRIRNKSKCEIYIDRRAGSKSPDKVKNSSSKCESKFSTKKPKLKNKVWDKFEKKIKETMMRFESKFKNPKEKKKNTRRRSSLPNIKIYHDVAEKKSIDNNLNKSVILHKEKQEKTYELVVKESDEECSENDEQTVRSHSKPNQNQLINLCESYSID